MSNVRLDCRPLTDTLPGEVRHTTFRFALAPTPEQERMLGRHAGAARFAYHECLRLVVDALSAKRADANAKLPWSKFDLIGAFNVWKRSEAAGRVFVAAPGGVITRRVTGLAWRHEICAQVFEEAAVDLSRALAAYGQAKNGKWEGRKVGFPRYKRKGRCRDRFRLRNKAGKNGSALIRVGEGHPRSVTLPRIGTIRVHDDTRRLRRLLRPIAQSDRGTGTVVMAPRARVLFATCSRHGSRWYVSLNIEAPDFHPERRHSTRHADDHGGFVGVDRGLAAFAVAATASRIEVGRFAAPKPLQHSFAGLRRTCRAASRSQPRSSNHAKMVRRLSRRHARIANIRKQYLHEVSNQLVKTYDRLCVEDLAVANLLGNRHLARAISDAAWAEFARQLGYKASWFGSRLITCDRWFPSTKTCSRCGTVRPQLRLSERVFFCHNCGLLVDRDCNAAANLAAWAEAFSMAAAQSPDRQAGGRVTNASGGKRVGCRRGDSQTNPNEGGTETRLVEARRRTSEKGAAGRPPCEEPGRL
jgi:putative transposase